MILLGNGTRLVEAASELPDLRNARNVFADYETTSFDDKKAAIDPWHDCWVAGLAVTVDDAPRAWYVPVNHRHGTNLPEDAVADWWLSVVSTAKRWVNHNVKFDAHVSANCWGVVVDPGELALCDTLTWAKLIDSDRQGRGGYGLDALARDWLKEDISRYELAIRRYLEKTKDYGRVPADVMAEYAGQDVMTTRRLARYIEAQMPESCHGVWRTETDLTGLLFEVERHGMRVNRLQLQKRELQLFFEMGIIAKRLEERVGRVWDPANNKDCFDVLCNQFGLPILAWTEEGEDEEGEPSGNPSFDKHALAQYHSYPYAPVDVIEDVMSYRKRATHKNFFVRPYQELAIDAGDGSGQAVMHPSYNQVVRTGRMSCKKPNSQQLDENAKELVLPPPGFATVSCDDCLPAGVLIPTPYGDKPIEEIAANLLPVLTYCNDGTLKFSRTSRGARIGYGAIYKITFDDGSTFECTATHGFERHGDQGRVNCEDLQSGDRLKHVVESRYYAYPSWQVNGRHYSKHRLVAEWIVGDQIFGDLDHVHHKDENKENWHADNLEVKDAVLHISEHSIKNYAKQNHSLRLERLRDALKNRRSYIGDKNPNWQGGKIKASCEACGESFDCWPSQDIMYCSDKCRSQVRSDNIQEQWNNGTRVRAEIEARKCAICGAEFIVKGFRMNDQRLCCSRSCTQKLNWKRRHEETNYCVVSVEHVRDDWYYHITVPETGQYVTTNGLVNKQSQVEFRTIIHYINDPYAVRAYAEDPDTDFHDWVANLIGIKRKPAKTANFLMAFGGGKEKLLKGLESNMDLVGDIKAEVDAMVARGEVPDDQKKEVFAMLARRRAQRTYDTYHESLPGLKRTSRSVARVCQDRGYVFNLMGRRRHLPREKAHIAFNTLNQSSAADMMKARMVKLWKYLRREGLWGSDRVHVMAQVHDDLTSTMPQEWAGDPRTRLGLLAMMETAPCELRVPLRCAIGWSVKHWREACKSAKAVKYDRQLAVRLGLHEDPLGHLCGRPEAVEVVMKTART